VAAFTTKRNWSQFCFNYFCSFIR